MDDRFGASPIDEATHDVEMVDLTEYEMRNELTLLRSKDSPTDSECCSDIASVMDWCPAISPDCRLILIIDTNELIQSCQKLRQFAAQEWPGFGRPVIYIPWVVLQELDYLKRSHPQVVSKVVSEVKSLICSPEGHVVIQPIEEWKEAMKLFDAKCNDDKVLQAGQLLAQKYPHSRVVLVTEDRILQLKCTSASLESSSVKQLESSLPRVPSSRSSQHSFGETAAATVRHSGVSELEPKPFDAVHADIQEVETVLTGILSRMIEKEMNSIYAELWPEVICVKPPWTFIGVLTVLEKHWVAVFRYMFDGRHQETVKSMRKDYVSLRNESIGDLILKISYLRGMTQLLESVSIGSSDVSRLSSVKDSISKIAEFLNSQTQLRNCAPPTGSQSNSRFHKRTS